MNNENNIEMVNVAGDLQNETNTPNETVMTDNAGKGSSSAYRCWKGVFDRMLALIGIVVSSPLLVLIAIAVRLDSPGNAMFRQERVGKDGRQFVIYKYRTMYVVHDDGKWKELITRYVQGDLPPASDKNAQEIYNPKKDPRLTKSGRLLRKTNLDELPQLFNIAKGDMSFVGPRPEVPFIVGMYNDYDRKTLGVTPGLTGLWQVSGRKQVPFKEMIRRDIYYIENQSLFLDIKILFLTVGTILRREGS
jgi:lipopolysaccharide/colanic/teichoic acid biosynthesis glycosyltransferase